MSNFEDLQQIVEFAQKLNQDKIILGAQITCHSRYFGWKKRLQKYDLFALSPSTASKHISNDILFQSFLQKVKDTAHCGCSIARDQMYQLIKKLYPDHHYLILVWDGGNMGHTSWSGGIAQAQFDTQNDKDYGHDVLIILY